MIDRENRCREPFAFEHLYLICEREKHAESERHSASAYIGMNTVEIKWIKTDRLIIRGLTRPAVDRNSSST